MLSAIPQPTSTVLFLPLFIVDKYIASTVLHLFTTNSKHYSIDKWRKLTWDPAWLQWWSGVGSSLLTSLSLCENTAECKLSQSLPVLKMLSYIQYVVPHHDCCKPKFGNICCHFTPESISHFRLGSTGQFALCAVNGLLGFTIMKYGIFNKNKGILHILTPLGWILSVVLVWLWLVNYTYMTLLLNLPPMHLPAMLYVIYSYFCTLQLKWNIWIVSN